MNKLTEPSFSKAEFGENFVWGVATAAFQIEGMTRQMAGPHRFGTPFVRKGSYRGRK